MTGQLKRHPHLFFKDVRLKKKSPPISFELRPQVHAILAPSMEIGDDVVRCGSGMVLPYRGKVSYGSVEPGRTPKLRGRIGTLLRREPPLGGEGRVREYLEHILFLQNQSGQRGGKPSSPDEVPYVGSLLDRPARDLNPKERRLLALGLALNLEDPALLLLHDPLTDLEADLAHALISEMSKRANEGAIVACIVPTERAAKQLSDRVHDLQGRRVVPPEVHFLVRSERVREVASLLSKSHEILSTEIRSSGDLIIGARSEEEAAREITQAICAVQVNVFEVRRVVLPLKENTHA